MKTREKRTEVRDGHEAEREALRVAIDKANKEDWDWIEAQAKGEDVIMYYSVDILEKHLRLAMRILTSFLKTLDKAQVRDDEWLVSHEERLARIEQTLG